MMGTKLSFNSYNDSFNYPLIVTDFYVSMLVTALVGGILFLGWPPIRPIDMYIISEQCLEGISSNMAQIFTWTQR